MKSLLIAFTLIIGLSARPSHAIMGAVAASPGAFLAGLLMSGFGFGGAAGYEAESERPKKLAFAFAGLLGIVILDESSSITYGPLSSSEAQKLGLSTVELSSYNGNIDQINALAEHVNALVVENKLSTEESAALWGSVKDSIPSEAFSGMLKVTAQVIR